MTVYRTIFLPTLMYGSETWVITDNGKATEEIADNTNEIPKKNGKCNNNG